MLIRSLPSLPDGRKRDGRKGGREREKESKWAERCGGRHKSRSERDETGGGGRIMSEEPGRSDLDDRSVFQLDIRDAPAARRV